MRLSTQQFEETKTRVLSMDPNQKKELAKVLNLAGATKEVLEKGNSPGFRLHKQIQQCLHSRTQSNIPSLANLKKVQPKQAARFEAVGKMLDEEINSLFRRITRQEEMALHRYFVTMALHRVEDMDLVLSANNLMDALLPLSELVDDQLPGYRSAGILQTMILRHLTGGQPCLAPTQ